MRNPKKWSHDDLLTTRFQNGWCLQKTTLNVAQGLFQITFIQYMQLFFSQAVKKTAVQNGGNRSVNVLSI
jgi:hypothetical protein